MHDLESLIRRAKAAEPLADLPAGPACRRLRLAAGLSQESLGAIIGCSKVSVGFYEAGQRRPQVELEHRYRKALRLCEELSGARR